MFDCGIIFVLYMLTFLYMNELMAIIIRFVNVCTGQIADLTCTRVLPCFVSVSFPGYIHLLIKIDIPHTLYHRHKLYSVASLFTLSLYFPLIVIQIQNTKQAALDFQLTCLRFKYRIQVYSRHVELSEPY